MAIAWVPAALCVALWTGCAPHPRNHYVKSAKTSLSDIPLVPAILPPGNRETTEMAVRVGGRVPSVLHFQTRPVLESDADPGGEDFRGDYSIRRDPLSLGIDLRHRFTGEVDLYLATGVNVGTTWRGSGLFGLGATIPFPWLHVRVSPAYGWHAYDVRVIDSAITHGTDFITGDPYTDTTVLDIRSRGTRWGPVAALSFSAWPPNPGDRAWTPYLQYQANWIGIGARDSGVTVPQGILVLRGRVVAAGLEYSARNGMAWNTRIAGEYLKNQQDGDWSYRVESGITFRLDHGAKTRR